MTYKEEQKAIIRAKHWIHDVIRYHQDVLDGEEPGNTEKAIFEKCEVILNALEKLIPKKPVLENTKGIVGIDMWHCPVCKDEIISDWNRDIANPYCHHCGQAIDWSEEE